MAIMIASPARGEGGWFVGLGLLPSTEHLGKFGITYYFPLGRLGQTTCLTVSPLILSPLFHSQPDFIHRRSQA